MMQNERIVSPRRVAERISKVSRSVRSIGRSDILVQRSPSDPDTFWMILSQETHFKRKMIGVKGLDIVRQQLELL